MLDLNAVKEHTYPIKFLGYELNLLPCSINNLRKYARLCEESTEEEVMTLTIDTLNNNKEGIVLSAEEVGKLSLAQRDILLTSFFEWQQLIRLQNPN